MSAILPPRIGRQRTGCQLARLNRLQRERNRAEVWDGLLFPLAIVLAIAVYKGLDILFSR